MVFFELIDGRQHQVEAFSNTLMGEATKRYIELPTASFVDFRNLGNAFLHHFQLPIQYDSRIELLTSFQQGDSTHIFEHIHGWWRMRREIKEDIPDSFLLDWFLKSLHPQICKDVTMMGPRSEERAIHAAKHIADEEEHISHASFEHEFFN
jgi:hypothetical protein